MSSPDSDDNAHRGTWKTLGVAFDAAVERLPQALQAEGFGVITQIDLRETFQAKLGVAFRRYRIFGACNPAFALKAVETEPRAGLLLPCNIVLFERDDGSTELGIIDPGKAPDESLASKQVEQALEAAIGALEPMYREVLLLRDIEGLTAAEVARVTGASVQAVKSRLHRARLSVRAHVAPLLGIPTDLPAAAGTCPDVLALFSSHLEGQISAEVCAEMERHIEACPRCKGACDSLKRTLSLCHALPAAPIPAAVQASVKIALRDFLSGGA